MSFRIYPLTVKPKVIMNYFQKLKEYACLFVPVQTAEEIFQDILAY
jgi:hypothetical protein